MSPVNHSLRTPEPALCATVERLTCTRAVPLYRFSPCKSTPSPPFPAARLSESTISTEERLMLGPHRPSPAASSTRQRAGSPPAALRLPQTSTFAPREARILPSLRVARASSKSVDSLTRRPAPQSAIECARAFREGPLYRDSRRTAGRRRRPIPKSRAAATRGSPGGPRRFGAGGMPSGRAHRHSSGSKGSPSTASTSPPSQRMAEA